MRRLIHLIVLALVTTAVLAGCERAAAPAAGPPVVVVSVLPQAYFVERLAGDLVEREGLVPDLVQDRLGRRHHGAADPFGATTRALFADSR